MRTGNFEGFLALLTEDAVLDFEGVPERGALVGKAAGRSAQAVSLAARAGTYCT